MLFKYRIVWVVALASAFMGCVASGGIDTPMNENMKIRLWAGIDNASAKKQSTRGDANSTSGILTPTSDSVLTIGMVRIDELKSDDYPAFVNCGNDGKPNPIKAELGLPDPNNSYHRDINFLSSSQFFYTATDIVKFAAWYPFEKGVYNSTEEQTTVTFPVPGDVDVMYGNVVSGSQSEGFNVMTFDHALCVYRIYIYSMHEDEEGSRWGKLETMNIEKMPTSCTITLPKEKEGDGAKRFAISYGGELKDLELDHANNNIYFNPGDKIPVGLDKKRLVAKCISAPPADGLLHISLTTSKAEARQRVSIARNFQAGHAYDIVLRFSDHGLINADVSVEDWIEHDHDVDQDVVVDMYYDLSRYGTANCYLINSANYGYSFNATVKGNGDGSLVGVTDTTLNPGYIDILWSDMPDYKGKPTVQLVSHQLSNNRVLFNLLGNPDNIDDKTLKAEGNVIIAAAKDSMSFVKKEFLWTWHLWITDRVNNHGNPNGYIVQDRNLGAIAAEPDSGGGSKMYGLYYQWGRPTPLRDNATPTSNQATTPEEAVKNPTKFYGAGAENGDWLVTPNNKLWGYQNDFTKVQKTIYDPCPQGYMVADKRIWESIAIYQLGNTWERGLGTKITVSNYEIWYPIQGYIGTDGKSVATGSEVRLWSSVVDINNSENPYELRYKSLNNNEDNKGVAYTSAEKNRNVALPVRCVSGHSVESITNLSDAQTANCYMVHRPGYYKFKATVRGNGVTQLLATDGNQTVVKDIADGMSETFTPAKVDFLWYQGDFSDGWPNDKQLSLDENQDGNPDEIPMTIMDEGKPDADGYVKFYVGKFHKGNVGLAAYDTEGNIIWSWHIWFTDKSADVQTGNYFLMDRFLGATYAPTISGNRITFTNDNQRLATYGFYYQWGKKDPFFGPRSVNATDNTNNDTPQCSTYWTKPYNGEWSARDTFNTAGQVRVCDAPATPLTFRKRSGNSDGGDNSFWYLRDPIVTTKTSQHLWGYGQVGNSEGQGYTKTMHDPCPPGYMVMYHQVWYYNKNQNISYAGSSTGGATLSNEDEFHSGGIVLTKDGFDRAWYPFTGLRGGGNGRISTMGEGRIASCMPYSDYNTRGYNYTNSSTTQYSDYGSAVGRVVRCMKE